MQTLIVRPAVLLSVADRLDQLAAAPRISAAALQACLRDLEHNWSGGTAAALAHQRLRDLARLASSGTDTDRDHGRPAPDSLAALDRLPPRERDQLIRSRHDLPSHLDDGLILGFDPRGDGRLIVAFGDPGACRNVAVLIPGAGTDLGNAAKDLDRARTLRQAAGRDTAVVMWLGYDPPDFADAMLERSARAAAEPLRRFLTGLRSTHDGEIGQLTAIGHSYGSVVMGVAERDGDLDADTLIVVGSPGLGVSSAADLRDPTRIWHSTAANDPIRLVPGILLGTDPAHKSFGGNEFHSAPRGHSGYFSPGNPALTTMAAIVAGHSH